VDLFCETLFVWKIATSYGIAFEAVGRVGFLFELAQNWAPAAVPDLGVCMSVIVCDI
jgi:hypothetical protein